MDAEAWRIAELVVEACGLIGGGDVGQLTHLRRELAVLARETQDGEAADTACGVVADIDRALTTLEVHPHTRAA